MVVSGVRDLLPPSDSSAHIAWGLRLRERTEYREETHAILSVGGTAAEVYWMSNDEVIWW